jgi:hypothetical protein
MEGRRLVWTDRDRLVERSLDSGAETVLASGNLSSGDGDQGPAPLLDGDDAYWIRTADDRTCSPPCLRRMEKITPAGVVVLAEGRQRVTGLAQDAESLYWEESDSMPIGSSVKKVPKAGGATVVLVDGTLLGAASWTPTGGIAVSGGSVFFGDSAYAESRVLSVSTAGGAVSVLASMAKTAEFDTARMPRKIVADDAGLAWIDDSGVRTLPLAGGAPATAFEGLDRPLDLVLAGSSAIVLDGGLTTIWGSRAGAGRILAVPRDGSATSTLLAGLDGPTSVVSDGTSVAWAEAWRVGSAPLAGGAAVTRASGIAMDLPPFVRRGDRLLVADGPFLKTLPAAGGPVEMVAGLWETIDALAMARPVGLVADADAAYVAYFPPGMSSGAVRRIPLGGGAATDYAAPGMPSPQDCALRVAVDATHVYWTSGSSSTPVGCAVLSALIGGGPTTVVVDGLIRDFALDGVDLWFTSGVVMVVNGTGSHLVGGEALNRVSVEGGPVTSFPVAGFPSILAVDAARLYWIGLEGIVGMMQRSGAGQDAAALGAVDETPQHLDALVADGTGAFLTSLLDGVILRVDPGYMTIP